MLFPSKLGYTISSGAPTCTSEKRASLTRVRRRGRSQVRDVQLGLIVGAHGLAAGHALERDALAVGAERELPDGAVDARGQGHLAPSHGYGEDVAIGRLVVRLLHAVRHEVDGPAIGREGGRGLLELARRELPGRGPVAGLGDLDRPDVPGPARVQEPAAVAAVDGEGDDLDVAVALVGGVARFARGALEVLRVRGAGEREYAPVRRPGR